MSQSHSTHCTCSADGNVHHFDCGIVEWNRSDEGQREAVERRAAVEGIEPYELLLRWASEHGATALSAEQAARKARASHDACLADAHRWFGVSAPGREEMAGGQQ